MQNKDSLKANLTNQSFWLRLPFMVLFYFLWKLAGCLLLICIVLQTLVQLIKGKPQANLLAFSAQLTTYGYQSFRYLSFNSEVKPFPFASWPTTEAADDDPYANPEQTNQSAAENPVEKEQTKEEPEEETPNTASNSPKEAK